MRRQSKYTITGRFCEKNETLRPAQRFPARKRHRRGRGHTASSFRIEGTERYEIEELGRGVSVSHAFYMSGDGLSSVRVRVTGRVATRARIAWTLWRGSAAPENPWGTNPDNGEVY